MNALKHNKSLTTLIIQECFLTNDDIIQVAAMMAMNASMRVIDLRMNGFDKIGVHKLLLGLELNHSIVSILMDGSLIESAPLAFKLCIERNVKLYAHKLLN